MEDADGHPNERQLRIVFLNVAGEYRLHKSIRDLHDWDPKGILHGGVAQAPAVAGHLADEEPDGFDSIEPSGGPGMSLATYLPKQERNLATKLRPSLTPSTASQAAVAAQPKGKAKGKPKAKAKGKDQQ